MIPGSISQGSDILSMRQGSGVVLVFTSSSADSHEQPVNCGTMGVGTDGLPQNHMVRMWTGVVPLKKENILPASFNVQMKQCLLYVEIGNVGIVRIECFKEISGHLKQIL